MFPALTNTAAEAAPGEIPCHQYPAIAEFLPALVRRTAQGVWYDMRDTAIAASDVFDEADGVHSFFEVSSIDEFVAVGTYLSRGGDKPFKRATYFCVLPNEVRAGLEVAAVPTHDSRCAPLNALHRHVRIADDQRESLFRVIQEGKLFNYRVDKPAMLSMSAALRSCNCLDYTAGPCHTCAEGATG